LPDLLFVIWYVRVLVNDFFPISSSYPAVNYCLPVANVEMKKTLLSTLKKTGRKMLRFQAF